MALIDELAKKNIKVVPFQILSLGHIYLYLFLKRNFQLYYEMNNLWNGDCSSLE